MKITTSYKVKIKHYRRIFKNTIRIYREAVDFVIPVVFRYWDEIKDMSQGTQKRDHIDDYIHATKQNPKPKYKKFDEQFYKMPSYIRRAAITDAIGKVSSYKSNLANWEQEDTASRGERPGYPRAGFTFPVMYRDGSYVRTNTYTARIKIYTRNTWDWVDINLRKSDVDYIRHHCLNRKESAPTLMKKGKEWYLQFAYEEYHKLNETVEQNRRILAVDLGLNSPAVCSVMESDGTIQGRHFCSLPAETDHLKHALNRIKKAQQKGSYENRALWGRAKGINDDIADKTSDFIIKTAVLYNVDVIVFEHLDLQGKKKGSKKERLHMWKAQAVQQMTTDKAHRLGIRISHVNAWKTSQLAFDGSGTVTRGNDAGFNTYSICRFQNGKIYNCDLNASYNIGARYFIRELLKTLSETRRLAILAKVPECAKRSTCTLSSLISLNAALEA